MDRREAMAISGSNYYMQRGMGGSGSGPFQSSNPNVSFQSNIGGGSMGSTLSIEPSPVVSPHGVNVGAPSFVPSAEPVRRKRGRPRKYGPDGAVSLALLPASSTPPVSVTPNQKRGRGRPPGTGRKQQLASLGEWLSGSAGMGFTPHVITIAIGEDITTKIMSFSQQGPRAIYIMSANGSVSTVTLRQPSTSGGSVTYEGHFEIICLSGSYLVTDNGGPRGRTGGLSVLLASPDGRVIGGGVGGVLLAASPVQVIVGSFLWGSSKAKSKAGAGLDGAGNLDRQTDDNPAALAITPPSQNLTPTSSVGVWPGSRPMDMQNAHVDIDLMRE
ncbi:AT-hook motif nuclear-localized protein [Actinidia chinensis var. chinensis]|uniref:AT-hook motif nuclear-localized protein n=1 Tax=Actinidia chinensis var. chinensis TaxID=1590841 RepID=A0A2R6Q8W3_ACTCC|nr:AT-hook motif nuclear-localized protein [Actinidia chinensis var. chinensis]